MFQHFSQNEIQRERCQCCEATTSVHTTQNRQHKFCPLRSRKRSLLCSYSICYDRLKNVFVATSTLTNISIIFFSYKRYSFRQRNGKVKWASILVRPCAHVDGVTRLTSRRTNLTIHGEQARFRGLRGSDEWRSTSCESNKRGQHLKNFEWQTKVTTGSAHGHWVFAFTQTYA